MFKSITEVRTGDVIIEPGGGRTTVTKVEINNPCKNHTHINNKDCYENFADVRVQD